MAVVRDPTSPSLLVSSRQRSKDSNPAIVNATCVSSQNGESISHHDLDSFFELSPNREDEEENEAGDIMLIQRHLEEMNTAAAELNTAQRHLTFV